MANYHVTKHKDGRWKVKRENSERASGIERTQADAEKEAKRLSGNAGGGEVLIHGKDNKIREKDTVPPANDPRKSKG